MRQDGARADEERGRFPFDAGDGFGGEAAAQRDFDDLQRRRDDNLQEGVKLRLVLRAEYGDNAAGADLWGDAFKECVHEDASSE